MILRCRGCGAEVDPLGPSPWVCPHRDDGDDVDHVLVVPLPDPAEPIEAEMFSDRRAPMSNRAAAASGTAALTQASWARVCCATATSARAASAPASDFNVRLPTTPAS